MNYFCVSITFINFHFQAITEVKSDVNINGEKFKLKQIFLFNFNNRITLHLNN